MIARSENALPRDLRKILYDLCIAGQISHPVENNEETPSELTAALSGAFESFLGLENVGTTELEEFRTNIMNSLSLGQA